MGKNKINYRLIIRIFIWIYVFYKWIQAARYQLNVAEIGLKHPYAYIDFRELIIQTLIMFLIIGFIPWSIYFIVDRIIKYLKKKKASVE